MQGCHTCRINCSVKIFKALGMHFSLSKMKNWLRAVEMEGGDQSNHELNLSHWKLKKSGGWVQGRGQGYGAVVSAY